MRTADSIPGTQTVLRAAALLKLFTDDQPERRLSDLAREADLNKTTAYRLLSALERAGLLARGHDGEAYRLGPEVIALGGRALRSNSLRLAGRAELEALAQSTGESVTLEVLVGFETLILDEIQGHHVVGTTQSVGTRWPANTTSTGKAILACLSDEERAAVWPRRLPAPTAKSVGDRETLLAELERVRSRGFAVQAEELEADFTAVGAPILNHDGRVVAAASVGGPSHRLPPARIRELAPLVMKAAARISEALGFRP